MVCTGVGLLVLCTRSASLCLVTCLKKGGDSRLEYDAVWLSVHNLSYCARLVAAACACSVEMLPLADCSCWREDSFTLRPMCAMHSCCTCWLRMPAAHTPTANQAQPWFGPGYQMAKKSTCAWCLYNLCVVLCGRLVAKSECCAQIGGSCCASHWHCTLVYEWLRVLVCSVGGVPTQEAVDYCCTCGTPLNRTLLPRSA